MTRAKRFTLLTSAHVTNNPRLVKEADLLVSAGADVRVVAASFDDTLAVQDRALAAAHGWRLVEVPTGDRVDRVRATARALAQRGAQLAFARGLRVGAIPDYAASRLLRALRRAAVEEHADVIIGHNLPALPAAARAAHQLGAALGFDCEDLHAEEESDPARAPAARVLAAAVERRWLPDCEYLTASSDGIANEIARRYGVLRPHVILNVFPLSTRGITTEITDRTAAIPSVYWFSQTIGPDRGVEDAITAVGGLPWPVALHLRGNISPEYAQRLIALADSLGMQGRLVLHPPAAADAMVPLAMQHDVGLASEQPVSLNRQLCVTNKLFVYMTAGLAIAASDTPGQRQIMEQAGDVGFLFAPGSSESLRAGLWALLASPTRLAQAKQRSLDAATARFCWEIEAPRLRVYLLGVRAGSRRTARNEGR